MIIELFEQGLNSCYVKGDDMIMLQKPSSMGEGFRLAREAENRENSKDAQPVSTTFSEDVLNRQVNVVFGGVGRERVRCENRTKFQGRICYVCRGKKVISLKIAPITLRDTKAKRKRDTKGIRLRW